MHYEVKSNKAADLEKSEMSTNLAHGCKTLIVLYHMPREKEVGGGSNNIVLLYMLERVHTIIVSVAVACMSFWK